MFCVVSRGARERDLQSFRVQKISMRTFASSINKPMLLQFSNELANLARHAEGTTGWHRSKLHPFLCLGFPASLRLTLRLAEAL